ncbi:unnamed protein product [Clavelina lepadiformis]|uniref:G-protein coupled receptors family 1 profile domain-containing protein n=1 Tax=Clavelina lepadiformis TaxID=159417 RepID=A0ABP0G4B7_CLALP
MEHETVTSINSNFTVHSIYYTNNSYNTASSKNGSQVWPTQGIPEKSSISKRSEFAMAGLLSCFSLYLVGVTVWYNVKHFQKKLKRTNVMCLVSTLLLLFESCWFQLEIQMKDAQDSFCTVYSVTNVFISTINKTIIYVIFWMRQSSFYRTRALSSIGPKKFAILNKSLIAAIIVFAMTQITVLSCIPLYGTDNGCKYGKPTGFLKIFSVAVFTIITLFQIFLLIPILYPIVKHLKAAGKLQSNSRLGSVMIRLCVCTAICVITDIIFVGVIAQQHDNLMPFSFIPICYSFNMFINVVCMIVSFADYKIRFFPFLKSKVTPTPGQSQQMCVYKIHATSAV